MHSQFVPVSELTGREQSFSLRSPHGPAIKDRRPALGPELEVLDSYCCLEVKNTKGVDGEFLDSCNPWMFVIGFDSCWSSPFPLLPPPVVPVVHILVGLRQSRVSYCLLEQVFVFPESNSATGRGGAVSRDCCRPPLSKVRLDGLDK